MNRALLLRLFNRDSGSEGVVYANGEVYRSLELPWRDNETGYSCIPAPGEYLCRWWKSPSKGWCYRLYNVPARDYILIHSANYAGDRKKGMVSHLRGCIALGKNYGTYNGQRGIFGSKPVVNAFNEAMGREPFILEVKHAGSYIVDIG